MQEQLEIVWAACSVTFASFLIVPAVLASIDAIFGISSVAARLLKRPRRADVLLLFFLVPGTLLAIRGIGFLLPVHVTTLPHFLHVEDMRRYWQQEDRYWASVQEAAQYLRAFMLIEGAAAFACLAWAVRLKRSVWVWLPLSVISNIGGLLWLVVRGRSFTPREMR